MTAIETTTVATETETTAPDISDNSDNNNNKNNNNDSDSESTLVEFGVVNVREYERILGDHPDADEGPPLAIGWEYESVVRDLPVDDFEMTRQSKRRSLQSLRLSPKKRTQMILSSSSSSSSPLFSSDGYSRGEIIQAIKTASKDRSRRERNAKIRPRKERAEEVVESARRMVMKNWRRSRRPSSFKKHTKKNNETEFVKSGILRHDSASF